MRILVLTPTFLPMVGGAEILLLEVYRRLATRHEICLLTPEKKLPAGELDSMINFRVVRFRDRWSLGKLRGHRLTGGVVPPFSLSAVSATRKTVRQFRPDVMNCHFMNHTGLAAMVAHRQFSLPTVLTLVGRDVPGPRVPFLWKYYSRLVARSVSDVTFISEYCRKAIFNSVKPQPGHIIPGGVDLGRFRPGLESESLRSRLHLPPDAPILFSMQRLGPEKRADVILRAMPHVLRRNPAAVLVIGGTGPEKARLTSLARTLGLQQSVLFAGYVDSADLPSYYAMCDLFVFHSTYETFGIVLAEAMAAGKAIVSVSSTAIPEVVQDGVTGMLVPPLNPEAMANGIVHLLDSPQKRAQLGLCARSWAEQHFDWNSIASQYEAVLETCRR